MGFEQHVLGSRIWIKYDPERNPIWVVTHTIYNKIVVKDRNENIVLSTKSEKDFEIFLKQEWRNQILDQLLRD